MAYRGFAATPHTHTHTRGLELRCASEKLEITQSVSEASSALSLLRACRDEQWSVRSNQDVLFQVKKELLEAKSSQAGRQLYLQTVVGVGRAAVL